MAVGYPLYQNQANAIADELAEMAEAIRSEPETLSLELKRHIDGTDTYHLDLEASAGYFALSVRAFGDKTSVDNWHE